MPQAQTVDQPKRWPLIILPENRQEDTTRDARLVNGYMEKELRGDFFLYKRPGLATSTQPSGAAGTGRGTYNWLGNIYSVVGTTLYKGSVSKGTVDGTNGVYRFDSCMGATPKLVLGNGVFAYTYDDAGGLVKITDVDFPAAFVKGWAYLDATTYVMTAAANIQGSAINNPTSWDPLNTLLVQIEPSAGVALAKQLVYVIAMKQASTEVFYDAGNATGSPLGRVQGAKVNWGCISADSVRELDGALFWLATNRSAAVQVLMMDNLKAEIISTPAIERLLGEADFSVVYSWILKYEGHRWYVITLKNNNLTLAFDMTTHLWSQWTDTNGNYMPIVDSTYNTTTAQTFLQHESDGYLYTVDSANYNDAGNTITVDIYTPNYDGGSDRSKMLNMLYFDADQTNGSMLQVRFSDDDYQSWSDFRNVDLSQPKPYLDECGSFDKRRAIHIRHQSNTRFRIRAVGFQIDIGTL